MSEPLTIRIEATPHSFLNPNSGKHHRTKRPHYNALRDAATLSTASVMRGKAWKHSGPIALEIDVYWEKRRQYVDFDNGISMNKAVVDAIFHHLDADDKQVVSIAFRQHKDMSGVGYMVFQVIPFAKEKVA